MAHVSRVDEHYGGAQYVTDIKGRKAHVRGDRARARPSANQHPETACRDVAERMVEGEATIGRHCGAGGLLFPGAASSHRLARW